MSFPQKFNFKLSIPGLSDEKTPNRLYVGRLYHFQSLAILYRCNSSVLIKQYLSSLSVNVYAGNQFEIRIDLESPFLTNHQSCHCQIISSPLLKRYP